MSTSPIRSDIRDFPKVGTVPNQAGKILLFCNGIENNLECAKKSARAISQVFQDREVFVAHNQTSLLAYIKADIEANDAFMVNLRCSVVNYIDDERTNGTAENAICVTIFAHSHGAHLTKGALCDTINPRNRGRIKVYAFGGAAIIPKSLASVVENYFSDGDIIAEMGTVQPQDFKTFRHAKKINKRVNAGESVPTAIGALAYEDLHRELLNTIHSDAHTRDAKRAEYESIFVNKDQTALDSNARLAELIQEYLRCISENNIFFFQSPPLRQVKMSSIREDLGAIITNLVEAVAAGVPDAFKNHEFTFYMPEIRRIASQGTS